MFSPATTTRLSITTCYKFLTTTANTIPICTSLLCISKRFHKNITKLLSCYIHISLTLIYFNFTTSFTSTLPKSCPVMSLKGGRQPQDFFLPFNICYGFISTSMTYAPKSTFTYILYRFNITKNLPYNILILAFAITTSLLM